jgi:hypothetical protein
MINFRYQGRLWEICTDCLAMTIVQLSEVEVPSDTTCYINPHLQFNSLVIGNSCVQSGTRNEQNQE